MCNHILGLLSNKCNPVFKSGWWVITVRFTITTGCLETTTLGKLCSHSLCPERWWQPWWAWWTSWCWKWWQQGWGWWQKPPQASEELCLPLKSGECTVLQRKEQDGGLGTVTLRVRRFDHCYNTKLDIFLKVGLTELSEEDSAVGNFISSVQGSPIKWVVGLSHVLDHLSTHWNRPPGPMIKPYSGIPERFRFPL